MPEARQPFPIEEQLRNDMKTAMKARDQVKVDTLRMVMAAIHTLEVARTDRKHAEYGQPVTEPDVLKVMNQEAKKRAEAAQIFRTNGRAELAEKEQREYEIIQSYLQGSQLSEDEIRAEVARLVEEHGKDFRKVMPQAAKALKGRADGSRVQVIVRELTS
jgi:uncharacterized protein YqeY